MVKTPSAVDPVRRAVEGSGGGGGEPAEPGDPGALIGRERPEEGGRPGRRAGAGGWTGDAAYAERAEMGRGRARAGEGQRAENAFNNINIGGGDDGRPAGFSQGPQVEEELIME